MPFGGTISSDDYYAGTRAAACGGTTTVFDFILQDFGETMVDAIKRRDALCAPDAAVDYAFHVAVKDVSNGLIDTIEDAVNYGVSSFKVFMVYDFGVTDGVFYKVLEKAKSCGAMISVHAENKQLIDVLTERYLSEGKTSAWYHYMSRPEFVEGEADIRAIQLAKSLDSSCTSYTLQTRKVCRRLKEQETRAIRYMPKPVRSTLNLPPRYTKEQTAETLYALLR